ncbi:hypothetical protein B0H14DRAFT_3018068, partial [Mycena olivaceomarginata]
MRRREGRRRRGRRRGVWMRTMTTMGTRWRMTRTMITHLRGARRPHPVNARMRVTRKLLLRRRPHQHPPLLRRRFLPRLRRRRIHLWPMPIMRWTSSMQRAPFSDALRPQCSCCDTAAHTSTSSSGQSFRGPSVSTPLPTPASTILHARVLDRVRLVSAPAARRPRRCAQYTAPLALQPTQHRHRPLRCYSTGFFRPYPVCNPSSSSRSHPSACTPSCTPPTSPSSRTSPSRPRTSNGPPSPSSPRCAPSLSSTTAPRPRRPSLPSSLSSPALAALHYPPARLSATDAPPPPDARARSRACTCTSARS